MRDEVDLWLSHGARTSLRDKWSWATFINSSLPTLILDDDRVILDANICMANLIGAPPDDLVGQSLDAIMADTSHTRIDQEWLLLRKTGALVGLRNFFRPDGGVFAAEYALRSVQPGIRSLTFTSLRQDPIAEEKIFHRAGPRHLVL
jgi:PAS domain S-box-containing protein